MSGGIGGGESGVPETLLTTKGQIHGYSTTNSAVSISGVDDYLLTEDSTNANGIAWKVNSGITASSTNTLTNKSIAFSGNTITATLAELDTALGTTGTASSSTFLRGDNSWATISAGASCSDSLIISGQTNTLCKWLELGA